MSPDLLLLVLRFLRFGLAILLWGSGIYLLTLAPARLSERLRARLSLLPAAVAVGLTVVTALRLPLLAASFGAGWSDAVAPDVLTAVLQTWTGTVWAIDAVLCALMLFGLLAGRRVWPAETALAGLLLVSSVTTGHAAIGPGSWSGTHQFIDGLHLLAAGFWLGALPSLALTLRHEGASPEAIRTVERFSVAGQAAVAVVIGTGVTNAILIKGGTPLRWSSTYDLLLLAKLAVVLAMIGIACFNHFGLLPRLTTGSNRAARAMRRGALAELALGAAALGLVTLFGTLDTA